MARVGTCGVSRIFQTGCSVRSTHNHLLHTGEWSYLYLSLVSKGLLGGTLITSVLMFDNFEEASAAAS